MPSNCLPLTWYGTFFSTIVLSVRSRAADINRKCGAPMPVTQAS
jgi:hypothetical protein